MPEPTWFTAIIIGAILTIPFNIGVNLITPRIQDWLDRQSLSSRGKTLKRLQAEHERVKNYRADPQLLQLTVSSLLIKGFIGLFLIVLLIAVSPFLASTAWILFIVLIVPFIAIAVLFRLMQLDDDLTRVRRFDTYEAKTLSKISELQARLKPRKKQTR